MSGNERKEKTRFGLHGATERPAKGTNRGVVFLCRLARCSMADLFRVDSAYTGDARSISGADSGQVGQGSRPAAGQSRCRTNRFINPIRNTFIVFCCFNMGIQRSFLSIGEKNAGKGQGRKSRWENRSWMNSNREILNAAESTQRQSVFPADFSCRIFSRFLWRQCVRKPIA